MTDLAAWFIISTVVYGIACIVTNTGPVQALENAAHLAALLCAMLSGVLRDTRMAFNASVARRWASRGEIPKADRWGVVAK